MAAALPKPLTSLPSMSSVEVGVARKFWIKFYREAVSSMYTPFSVSLAAGNLDIGSFRTYVAQDAWFLKAFAQAYSLAEECADDDEAKISITELRRDVMEELKLHHSFAQKELKRLLYISNIGDSVGDLLCLLKADIGIILGSSSSLRKVGREFGISFVPLFTGVVKKQKDYHEGSSWGWKGLSGTLYSVSSWAEIHAFMLGW